MPYVAKDMHHQFIPHTLSQTVLKTRLAAFKYQLKQGYLVAQTMGHKKPLAYDYPQVEFYEVSDEQCLRAKNKDLKKYQALLVEEK